MLKKLVSKIRKEGVSKTCATVVNKLELLWLKRRCLKVFKGLRGIEIGGPSQLFSREGLLPVYEIAGSVDGCNYSADTLWTGNIPEGETYKYLDDKPHGHQYICDATKLDKIPSDTYDFLLSSHVLEHVANPLQALTEWVRVLKPGGWLLLIVPRREATFDHNRPTTTLEHIRDDFSRNTQETDLTHLPEILQLHDLSMDPQAGTPEQFAARSKNNIANRCLHQHIFDLQLATAVCKHLNMQIAASAVILPVHIAVLARKPVS